MPNTEQAKKTEPNSAPQFNRKGDIKLKKKGKGRIIALIVVVVLVGGAAALLYSNIFSIRDMTYDLLRKIPIAGSLIPAPEEGPEDKYASVTKEELISANERLEKELERVKSDLADSQSKNDLYVKEIARLTEFEEQQEQFKADKDEFDREVFDKDPLAFKKYYDQISPKNAEVFYKEAVVLEQASAEVKSYLSKIGGMDEKAAAKDLEELIPTDITLVVYIMRGLNDEKASLILENMTAANAAIVIKMMYPE